MTAVKRGFKRDIIDGMLDEICHRIDEREQRVYIVDTVETQYSKKLLEYCKMTGCSVVIASSIMAEREG